LIGLLTLIWKSPPSAIIFAGAKGVKDGRKDNIKHKLIDMRKKLSDLFKGVIDIVQDPVQPITVKLE
jgi:hypothetical protein